jgi:predicted RNA binding protein YcfA (HicA-like mRNA interferase family)
MVRGFYRELTALLKSNGWELKRQGKGDHEIWWHPETGAVVPDDRNCLSRHTANAVLRRVGLPKVF